MNRPHNFQPARCAARQRGLTLLEIMITVVVLSLGLLGLAGLQVTGLKNNRNAYYNSVAGQTVQDIAERLRVDTVTRTAITGTTIKSLAGSAADCAADAEGTFDSRVACLASALPGGLVRIVELSTTPKTMYIALRWTDTQLNDANGWGADTATNPATTACGAPAANTTCYYTLFRP